MYMVNDLVLYVANTKLNNTHMYVGMVLWQYKTMRTCAFIGFYLAYVQMWQSSTYLRNASRCQLLTFAVAYIKSIVPSTLHVSHFIYILASNIQIILNTHNKYSV